MGNPKRGKFSGYLERIKKGTNIFKMSKRLIKVWVTYPEAYLQPTQRSMMELF